MSTVPPLIAGDVVCRRLPWLEALIPENIHELYRINSTAVTVLSAALNFTLMSLILTERNATLQAYSKVLLQNCTIDLVFTLAGFLTHLVGSENIAFLQVVENQIGGQICAGKLYSVL